MIRKLLLAAVLVFSLPLVAGSSGAVTPTRCDTWNAWSEPQHHRVGQIDIVGGHGYGSGYHQSQYRSPPQPWGAYGDPQRRAAQGGYIQGRHGKVSYNVNLFGPLDENDTTHVYDTTYGGCVQAFKYGVEVKPKCIKTSQVKKPQAWGTWVPCGGY